MQIESPLQKPIQNKQHIVQMILSVAIFILFFYLWPELTMVDLFLLADIEKNKFITETVTMWKN